MDAKDLRTEAALGDRSNDGNAKYVQSSGALPCHRNKTCQDIGPNSLVKGDVPATRPCAVIGPDRVVPPPASTDGYLKKGPLDPWQGSENTYRRPPEYPHKLLDYQHPTRNISPRQTFQENMQRIMVPPSYNSLKLKEDHNFPGESNIMQMRNNKLNVPTDSTTKYCDVPYNVSPITNEQKNIRNSDISVSNMNSVLTRSAPHGWPPNSANIRPQKPYSQELIQYPEYPSCAGPRPMAMPRPHRTGHEEPGPGTVYPDAYYHEGNIRFKPYPPLKERYQQPRYEYIGSYPNPFHPPPSFPPHKYDLQKPVTTHPYPGYQQVPFKYLDSRMGDPMMTGYQRSLSQQVNYNNMPFRNQVIHPTYGPVPPGTCLQTNKFYPYPPDPAKSMSSNKPPYDANGKIYPEFENNRNKNYTMTEGFFFNEISRPHPMKGGPSLPPNYPPNIHAMPSHPYYRRESAKGFEYNPHLRGIDHALSVNSNPLSRFPNQFSPSAIAISPSDSNTSNDTNQTQGTSQEDYGYVSQSSTASVRSIDSAMHRFPPDYRRYDYRYAPIIKTLPATSKLEYNLNAAKDKKEIDVRQFLQMWNEGEDENSESNAKEIVIKSIANNFNNSGNKNNYENNSQEQLYVLGLVNVPSEELGKYEHIQKVSKLPENIKGYNSIELLHQFEEVIESSNLNHYNPKPPTSKEYTSLKSTMSMHGISIPSRPLSPLDVESKISQSVIHKEVGCNFEIKPCSPKMLNVEIATPIQNVLDERIIEKVSNPLIPPMLHSSDESIDDCKVTKCHDRISAHDNSKVASCKMTNPQYTINNTVDSVKTNYSIQDLESNSGVCLASLPRLDNDIELSFPEVNQQFINANKGETVITSVPVKDLPPLDIDHSDILDRELETEVNNTAKNSVYKDLSKLSKYRKLKRKSSGPNTPETNVQALRTDSVIIKNPDNCKSYENSIDKLLSPKINSREIQDNPMNLSVNIEHHIDITKSDFNKEKAVENNLDNIAIDFSITTEPCELENHADSSYSESGKTNILSTSNSRPKDSSNKQQLNDNVDKIIKNADDTVKSDYNVSNLDDIKELASISRSICNNDASNSPNKEFQNPITTNNVLIGTVSKTFENELKNHNAINDDSVNERQTSYYNSPEREDSINVRMMELFGELSGTEGESDLKVTRKVNIGSELLNSCEGNTVLDKMREFNRDQREGKDAAPDQYFNQIDSGTKDTRATTEKEIENILSMQSKNEDIIESVTSSTEMVKMNTNSEQYNNQINSALNDPTEKGMENIFQSQSEEIIFHSQVNTKKHAQRTYAKTDQCHTELKEKSTQNVSVEKKMFLMQRENKKISKLKTSLHKVALINRNPELHNNKTVDKKVGQTDSPEKQMEETFFSSSANKPESTAKPAIANIKMLNTHENLIDYKTDSTEQQMEEIFALQSKDENILKLSEKVGASKKSSTNYINQSNIEKLSQKDLSEKKTEDILSIKLEDEETKLENISLRDTKFELCLPRTVEKELVSSNSDSTQKPNHDYLSNPSENDNLLQYVETHVKLSSNDCKFEKFNHKQVTDEEMLKQNSSEKQIEIFSLPPGNEKTCELETREHVDTIKKISESNLMIAKKTVSSDSTQQETEAETENIFELKNNSNKSINNIDEEPMQIEESDEYTATFKKSNKTFVKGKINQLQDMSRDAYHINKELLSPWIQKLIMHIEGLCFTSKLSHNLGISNDDKTSKSHLYKINDHQEGKVVENQSLSDSLALTLDYTANNSDHKNLRANVSDLHLRNVNIDECCSLPTDANMLSTIINKTGHSYKKTIVKTKVNASNKKNNFKKHLHVGLDNGPHNTKIYKILENMETATKESLLPCKSCKTIENETDIDSKEFFKSESECLSFESRETVPLDNNLSKSLTSVNNMLHIVHKQPLNFFDKVQANFPPTNHDCSDIAPQKINEVSTIENSKVEQTPRKLSHSSNINSDRDTGGINFEHIPENLNSNNKPASNDVLENKLEEEAELFMEQKTISKQTYNPEYETNLFIDHTMILRETKNLDEAELCVDQKIIEEKNSSHGETNHVTDQKTIAEATNNPEDETKIFMDKQNSNNEDESKPFLAQKTISDTVTNPDDEMESFMDKKTNNPENEIKLFTEQRKISETVINLEDETECFMVQKIKNPDIDLFIEQTKLSETIIKTEDENDCFMDQKTNHPKDKIELIIERKTISETDINPEDETKLFMNRKINNPEEATGLFTKQKTISETVTNPKDDTFIDLKTNDPQDQIGLFIEQKTVSETANNKNDNNPEDTNEYVIKQKTTSKDFSNSFDKLTNNLSACKTSIKTTNVNSVCAAVDTWTTPEKLIISTHETIDNVAERSLDVEKVDFIDHEANNYHDLVGNITTNFHSTRPTSEKTLCKELSSNLSSEPYSPTTIMDEDENSLDLEENDTQNNMVMKENTTHELGILEDNMFETRREPMELDKQLSVNVRYGESELIINHKNGSYSKNYWTKKRKSLKRSLSDSALDDIREDTNEESENIVSSRHTKRKKNIEINNDRETHFLTDDICQVIQNNRRNSISAMHNEENVSFCILIDNNCIITEECEETDKICFSEVSENCLTCVQEESVNEEPSSPEMVQIQEEVCCEYTVPIDEVFAQENKSLHEPWVEDVACVETVVSDDIAENIVISASTSSKDTDSEEEYNGDETEVYSVNEHTDKLKCIYGDKMYSEDARFVDTLYRTPQMNVNKTLHDRESHTIEEYNRYYDKESLERVLSGSNKQEGEASNMAGFGCLSHLQLCSPSTPELFLNNENIRFDSCSTYKTDTPPLIDPENNNEDDAYKAFKVDEVDDTLEMRHEETRLDPISFRESSVDDVFSYTKSEESPKCAISSSPEVSSTTSEEKNSGILLKITNYGGSRVSEVNNVTPLNRISCKYTENKQYLSSNSNLPTRTLITKAAQKYIPPLKETVRDLKVKLPLPPNSLMKLRQLKLAKEALKPNIDKPLNKFKKEAPKKPKPKFEDVLKSIDEIQYQKHKEKSKKLRKSIPKVVIKKTGCGSHYASTSDIEKFNPDLTGRKWQPWVFLEKNYFIDKMALKKKTRAIFSHRKNSFVMAEKFQKYKSIGSTNFFISPPKQEDFSSGQLKYTIRLKHNY